VSGVWTLGLISLVGVGLGASAPVSAQQSEADAVEQVLSNYNDASNARNLERMLSLVAEDAQIDSLLAGAKVSKAKFAEALAQAFALGRGARTSLRGLKVSIVDPTHATVNGEVEITAAGASRSQSASHQWKLEKRDEKWLIVETNYKSRPR